MPADAALPESLSAMARDLDRVREPTMARALATPSPIPAEPRTVR